MEPALGKGGFTTKNAYQHKERYLNANGIYKYLWKI